MLGMEEGFGKQPANTLLLVGVLAVAKGLRSGALFSSYGYLRLLNYPASFWAFLVLCCSTCLFVVLQQPWLEWTRGRSKQVTQALPLVGLLGLLYAAQTVLFFFGLKYLGPIRTLLLTSYADVLYVYISQVFFAKTRATMHINRLRGLLLVTLGYAAIFFFDDLRAPMGLDPRLAARFSFGLISLSPTTVGAICVALSTCVELFRKNLMRGASDGVSGRTLHALSITVAAAVLCPLGLTMWANADLVRDVGGWMHFFEVLGFCVLVMVVGNYYVDSLVRPQLPPAKSTLVTVGGSLLVMMLLEVTAGEESISFVTVLAAILITVGQYLVFAAPERSFGGDLPLAAGGGAVLAPLANQLFLLIKSDGDARNIFIYLVLNLLFMFVELAYGVWNNSLGLISDACHMLFDCVALLIGLIALVIANWKANHTFTYGYGRVNVLSGFINAVFLVFIAFSVLFEAFERLFDTPEVENDKLLLVSFLGLVVNLVGLFVFHQAHEAAHGHSHSHGQSDEEGGHGHSHGHGHGEGKDENMEGVFLHILGDTLGSVGVIISSLFIEFFGWTIADPICSFCIALIIFLSVTPLLRSSAAVLLQRTPAPMEKRLPQCLAAVEALEGVRSYSDAHFWSPDGQAVVATLHVQVAAGAEPQAALGRVTRTLAEFGVSSATVQVDQHEA